MPNPALNEDLDLAHQLADAADAITLDRFQALDLVIETKADMTPVSDADTAAERAIRDLLAFHRPDDVVLGEDGLTIADGSLIPLMEPKVSLVAIPCGPL